MYKVKIQHTPDDYDHDTYFILNDGEMKGVGYIGKKDNTVGLNRCPDCSRDNYSMNVSSGVCTWCGFDAKPLIIVKG